MESITKNGGIADRAILLSMCDMLMKAYKDMECIENNAAYLLLMGRYYCIRPQRAGNKLRRYCSDPHLNKGSLNL